MATGMIKQPESYADYMITTVTVMDQSIAADAVTGNITVTATNSGYYPLGIIGFGRTGQGSTFANVVSLYISSKSEGSVEILVNARNMSTTSAITSCIVRANVLWKKIK